jgi:hypothetical protein
MIVETPKCLAMVLCDQIYQDPVSHRFSIIGTFHELAVPTFPFMLQFSIYVALTGGRGPIQAKVRIIHADALLEAAESGVWVELPQVEIRDPLAIIEGSFVGAAVCHGPGQHHIELYVNDELLMTRRLTIHQRGQRAAS